MLDLAVPWALLALPLPLLVLWLAPARREVVQAVRLAVLRDRRPPGSTRAKAPWSCRVPGGRWPSPGSPGRCIVLTLARPEWVGDPIERTEAARDIMLAVDISGSMATRDFAGADGARAARGSTASSRCSTASSPIAATTASGSSSSADAPYVLVPFTRDTEAARTLLDTLAPGMAGQNTVLGDAIGLAIRSFEASEVESRVLILLSDGTDTGSRMAPQKAAAIAAQNGVVIHTDRRRRPRRRLRQPTRSTSRRSRRSRARRAAPSTAPRTRPTLADIYAEIDALGTRAGRDRPPGARATPLAARPGRRSSSRSSCSAIRLSASSAAAACARAVGARTA